MITTETIRRLAPALALTAALSACSPGSPAQQAAETIEDVSDARADAIRQNFDNSAAEIRAKSEALRTQAANATDFDKRILSTRADALDREAALVVEHGRSKADAERADGEAKAKALRAQ
jgi:hypothetical protein